MGSQELKAHSEVSLNINCCYGGKDSGDSVQGCAYEKPHRGIPETLSSQVLKRQSRSLTVRQETELAVVLNAAAETRKILPQQVEDENRQPIMPLARPSPEYQPPAPPLF